MDAFVRQNDLRTHEREATMAFTSSTGKSGNFLSAPYQYLSITLLTLAGYGLSTPALADGKISAGQTFQLALEAQTTGDYDQMLAHLRSAAEAGHLGAQEMLGMALLVGPTLYGDAIAADRCEAGQWIGRALAQGSEVARHQWLFLGRVRKLPDGAAPCGTLASGD